MGWILFWIMCGVISSIIAVNKGRSGANWFWLGVLLGPFGPIIALVVSTEYHAIERKSLQDGTMKRCPNCAELVRSLASTCRYCGQSFPQTGRETITYPGKVVSTINHAAIRPSSRKDCPHCKGSNKANAAICQFCGESISSVAGIGPLSVPKKY